MTSSPAPIGPSPSSCSAEIVGPYTGDVTAEVSHLWGPLIAKAVDRTRKLEMRDVFALVQKGQFQLWLVWDPRGGDVMAAILTELWQFPRRKVARIIAAGGGSLSSWREIVLPEIEAWARAEGCASLEIHGRKGWARIYRHYEEIERVLSRELQS